MSQVPILTLAQAPVNVASLTILVVVFRSAAVLCYLNAVLIRRDLRLTCLVGLAAAPQDG